MAMSPESRRGHGSRPTPAALRAGEGLGCIAIVPCPGQARSLAEDIDLLQRWGASLVVTLAQQSELERLGVARLGDELRTRGIAWLHAPIADYGVPDAAFEALWTEAGRRVRQLLRQERNVVFHCRAGLGRSGTMAARTLVELGWVPHLAIAEVRRVRPGAIETAEQEAAVRAATRIVG